MSIRLDTYNNSWYNPGGSAFKRLLWYFVNAVFFQTAYFPFNGLKVTLLRLFGCYVGKGVVVKPSVNIKYPWLLTIGDYSWIGEKVWIDNLAQVDIGAHCCLSQGAFLLCGNHDYTKSTFDLMVKPIVLQNSVWVGAKSIVAPGTVMEEGAMLAAGSLGSGILQAFTIYQGNPALEVKKRVVGS